MILTDIDIGELVFLRAVSTRWKAVIESSFQSTQSLVLSNRKYNSIRWFNWIGLESTDFVFLKLGKNVHPFKQKKSQITISVDFCKLLHKLFPNIEKLVFKVWGLDLSINLDRMLVLLKPWASTLTTLSVSMTEVNFGPEGDSQVEFARNIGPNCMHLELLNDDGTDIWHINTCLEVFPRLFGQLTHLRLLAFKLVPVLDLICQHATVLQALDLEFEDYVRNCLVGLSLSFKNIICYFL